MRLMNELFEFICKIKYMQMNVNTKYTMYKNSCILSFIERDSKMTHY